MSGDTRGSGRLTLHYHSTRPLIPGDWTDPISCLICGAMLWVPFISAFMAITFGVIAFRQPRTRQHVLVTVGGLVLAAINLGFWGTLMFAN